MQLLIITLLIICSLSVVAPTASYNPFMRGGKLYSNIRQEWCVSNHWLLEWFGQLFLHRAISSHYQPNRLPRSGGILLHGRHSGLDLQRALPNQSFLLQRRILIQYFFYLIRPYDHINHSLSLHPLLQKVLLQIPPISAGLDVAKHPSCLPKFKILKRE